MAEPSPTRERWRFGATYAALVFGLMLIHLVPLSVGPGRIPGPDLLICITLAWVLRRPHYVPVLLVAALFLMADILFMRPLGLYAALVVLAVEFLRARAGQTREQTFPAEWA
ncbi:MAG: rod shape-determining protein MreD, partial [Pseudomonadota bacterium]